MLENLGYAFDVAKNGLDCLTLFNRNDYDLVLSDIQMPRLNGMQVASKIRIMKPEKRDVPIVAMTANADLAGAEKFYEAGINDVLAKPFNNAELLNSIEKWL